MIQSEWTPDGERPAPSPTLVQLTVNRELLESAATQPRQTFAKRDLHPGLFVKAAVLARGLICNHPFGDGNKRTGMVAALTFLDANGVTVEPPWEGLVQLALDIATRRTGVPEIAAALESWRTDAD